VTRKQVAETLGWPQTRIELVETGRIKVDHEMVATLVASYGIRLEHHHPLLAQIHDATRPTDSDKLTWIRSHALRKPPPPPSTRPATPLAKSPTN
jgi:hypothetical protein